MTKRKSTKTALITSALSLLLCMSMLLGTTFAWFTDSAISSGNIIQTGTLDVKMEWKDATATGAQQEYKDASEGAIFNNDKWEPGYVEAKNIKISNVGSLALKYNIRIAPTGEVSKLSDAIDVYYAESEFTLASRDVTELTKIGTLTEVLEGMPANMSGALKATEADNITIALKMQETAGNEYQGLSIGSSFSVVLMATQDNVEADSFDENYDDIEIPEVDVKVIDGNTFHNTSDGNIVLATVPYGNVEDSFVVPEGVTILGQGDAYDGAVPVFSKYSPIETITLPEGLTEIKSRAITGVKTLTSINFPSTLTAIREQALRQTGMTEINLPANVEVVGDGAFRDMANLTTVVIEGNTALGDYQFRSCPNLTDIYLLGDDVTFTGGSMFATHTDNGNAAGITIYVKNTTVAERVVAAQGFAYDYEIKILGEATDGSDAQDVIVAKNSAQLSNAIANAEGETVTVFINKGTYANNIDLTVSALGAAKCDELVFKAIGGEVKLTGTTTLGYRDQGTAAAMYDAKVTFDGIVFDHAQAGQHSLVVEDIKALNLVNCTIIGDGEYGITSSRGNATGPSKITNCTFKNAAMQLLGNFATGLVIDGCTFEDSRVNVQAGNGVTVQNCEFNNTLKAANVGDSFYAIRSNSTPITVKNCEINIDSELTEEATAQAKWYLLANRGTTNWTVENVAVTLSDAALMQSSLVVMYCASTGEINTTNLTVNGVLQ